MGNATVQPGDHAVRAGASARRGRRRGRRAAALSGAFARCQRSGSARRRTLAGIPGLSRSALERARPDKGRRSLRPGGRSRRVCGVGDVDDLEVRSVAAPLRRSQGRDPLPSPRAVSERAAGAHAPLHVGAPAGAWPPAGHSRAGHGHQRADDGVDDGHLLNAGRVRGAGDRHRQADRAWRLALSPRGHGRRRRDGDRALLREAGNAARRPALRRPGLRQRRRDRSGRAARSWGARGRGLGPVRRHPPRRRPRHPGAPLVRRGERFACGLRPRGAGQQRGAAGAPVRHPRARGARGPGDGRERRADPGAGRRRGRERSDVRRGRCDPRRAGHPRPARRAHQRRGRHGLVLRVGAGHRPALLGSQRDPRQARRQARRRLRAGLAAGGGTGAFAAERRPRRRHPRGRRLTSRGIYP